LATVVQETGDDCFLLKYDILPGEQQSPERNQAEAAFVTLTPKFIQKHCKEWC
jgi:hypothetical protein